METRGRGEERRGERMVTRGRRDGDERETRRRRELYTNRQGPFNSLSLRSIAGHMHGMVMRGRQGEEMAPMMRMVAPHLCIVLYSLCVWTT